MPVDSLTAAQEQRYGRYADEPTPAQLAKYCFLDDGDRARIRQLRGRHNQLGFALQLGTVRYLGTFLADPTGVPAAVLRFVAGQCALPLATDLARYRTGETRWSHRRLITAQYGYRDFPDQPAHFRLVRWLYARAWTGAERPSVLFDLATARLVEQKILLPGATVLARLVARVRDRAAARLWHCLATAPDAAQCARLDALLLVPPGARQSALDRLRRAPTRVSTTALLGALKRLTAFRALGVGTLDRTMVPPSRLAALARYAATAWAATIARMPDTRRRATLLAFARVAEAAAHDAVLTVLDQLLGALLSRVMRQGERARLRTLRDLDAAALRLREACQVLLDYGYRDPEVREAAFARVAAEDLAEAVAVVAALTRAPDDRYYTELLSRYSLVRQFLPTLLKTSTFGGTPTGQPLLDALAFLRQIEGQATPDRSDAPLEVVTPAWQALVRAGPAWIDRRAYTFCVLEQLRGALHRRDVFVAPRVRWGDPRAKLLQGAAWAAARPQICRTRGWRRDPQAELATLGRQLDDAYQRMATNLPTNTAVRVVQVAGRDTIVLTPLDLLPEPASLIALRAAVAARLPRVDLPEVRLEVQAQTGFAAAFTHLREGQARVADRATSLCAVLIAEACNIGLEPVIQREVPALTRDRSGWVQQHYLRAETISRANAQLVAAQAAIPLAQLWGGGEVASADGLRFVVPVRTRNAGPNPTSFGTGKGVTYRNYTSDQFSGFAAVVIPGTIKDALYVLDGLLEQQTILEPTALMTDTGSYADLIFGLFRLLGYQFSPRRKDLGDTRLWRCDPQANYGARNGVARQRINTALIAAHWDDLLRVAGSLRLGTVRASELIRTLQPGGHAATLARAISEFGRLAKTHFVLAYLADQAYRRRILTQLHRGESRHSRARALFHGQKGELRQRYREGQEDRLDALGLVVNILVVWTTRSMDLALAQVEHDGLVVRADDVARLSPLGFAHINLLGRYHFALPEALAQGAARALRDPATTEADDQAP